MNLLDAYTLIGALAAKYGWDRELTMGGVMGGDPVTDIWYDESHDKIYIHG